MVLASSTTYQDSRGLRRGDLVYWQAYLTLGVGDV